MATNPYQDIADSIDKGNYAKESINPYEKIANDIDNQPGTFKASVANTLGGGLASKGRAVEEFAQANNLPKLQGLGAKARSYGQSVVENNPLPVSSLNDVVSHPIETVKQAVGNAAAFMPENLLAQGVGRAIGTGVGALTGPLMPVAMPVLGAVGQFAGGALDAALNTYGGIRDTQDKNNIDDKGQAIIGSLGSGVIEQALGANKLIGDAVFKKGAIDTAERIAKGELIPEGMSRLDFIKNQLPKTMLRQGAEEGGEELLQSPIEQYTGGDDPTSKESLQQTALGGVMGAVGGSALGGAAVPFTPRGPLSKAANTVPNENIADNAAIVGENADKSTDNAEEQSTQKTRVDGWQDELKAANAENKALKDTRTVTIVDNDGKSKEYTAHQFNVYQIMRNGQNHSGSAQLFDELHKQQQGDSNANSTVPDILDGQKQSLRQSDSVDIGEGGVDEEKTQEAAQINADEPGLAGGDTVVDANGRANGADVRPPRLDASGVGESPGGLSEQNQRADEQDLPNIARDGAEQLNPLLQPQETTDETKSANEEATNANAEEETLLKGQGPEQSGAFTHEIDGTPVTIQDDGSFLDANGGTWSKDSYAIPITNDTTDNQATTEAQPKTPGEDSLAPGTTATGEQTKTDITNPTATDTIDGINTGSTLRERQSKGLGAAQTGTRDSGIDGTGGSTRSNDTSTVKSQDAELAVTLNRSTGKPFVTERSATNALNGKSYVETPATHQVVKLGDKQYGIEPITTTKQQQDLAPKPDAKVQVPSDSNATTTLASSNNKGAQVQGDSVQPYSGQHSLNADNANVIPSISTELNKRKASEQSSKAKNEASKKESGAQNTTIIKFVKDSKGNTEFTKKEADTILDGDIGLNKHVKRDTHEIVTIAGSDKVHIAPIQKTDYKPVAIGDSVKTDAGVVGTVAAISPNDTHGDILSIKTEKGRVNKKAKDVIKLNKTSQPQDTAKAAITPDKVAIAVKPDVSSEEPTIPPTPIKASIPLADTEQNKSTDFSNKESVPQRIITERGKKRKVDDIQKQITQAKEKEVTQKIANEIVGGIKEEVSFNDRAKQRGAFLDKHRDYAAFAQSLINNDHEKAADDIYRSRLSKEKAQEIFDDAKTTGLLNDLTQNKIEQELNAEESAPKQNQPTNSSKEASAEATDDSDGVVNSKLRSSKDQITDSKPESSTDHPEVTGDYYVDYFINGFTQGKFKNDLSKENDKDYIEAAKVFLGENLADKIKPKKTDGVELVRGLKNIVPQAVSKRAAKIADDFNGIAKALLPFMGKGDTRHYLNGIVIDDVTDKLIASNGHMVAIVKGIPDGTPTGNPYYDRDHEIDVASIKRPGFRNIYNRYAIDKDKGTGISSGTDAWIDAVYPTYQKAIDSISGAIGYEVTLENLASYTNGMLRASKFMEGEHIKHNAPITLIDGKIESVVNSKYLANAVDLLRGLGYSSADIKITSGAISLESTDGKAHIIIVSMRDDTGDLFKPYDLNKAEYGGVKYTVVSEARRRIDKDESRKTLDNIITNTKFSKLSSENSNELINELKNDLAEGHIVAVVSSVPELKSMRYNLNSDKLEWADGSNITDSELTSIVERANDFIAMQYDKEFPQATRSKGDSPTRIGGATIKRAAFIQSLLQSEGGGRPELLDALVRKSGQSLESIAKILYSKSIPTTTNPHTEQSLLSAIRKALDTKYYSGWTRAVLDTGKVKIVSREEAVQIAGNEASNAKGFYFPATDNSYLIFDNLSKDSTAKELQGLLSHEISIHQLRLLRNDKEFQAILKQVERLSKVAGSKMAQAASRVPKDTKAEHVTEEILAQFNEANPSHSITQKLIQLVRKALRAIGKTLPVLERAKWIKWANTLSENDIISMSNDALRSAPTSLQFDTVGRENDSIRLAQEQGYEGNNKGESEEWLRAVAKGLDMSHEARMLRAKEMGFITDIESVIEVESGRNRNRTIEDRPVAGRSGQSSVVSEKNKGGDNARRLGGNKINDPQTFYHGTADDLKEFDLDHPNRKDLGWLGEGVYITNRSEIADIYANNKTGKDSPNVMPLFIRPTNLFKATIENKKRLKYGNKAYIQRFTDKLKADGYDGAELTFPDGMMEIVVFNPSAVRSIFAAFDPDYKDSSNLLASKIISQESEKRLAPNGKPSLLNAVQYAQVRTPEFKKFFGDWENDPDNASQVVDSNGEPLVVYHATQSDFNEFEKNKIGSAINFGLLGKGFYFTADKENANNYARNMNLNTGIKGGERIIHVFLNIRRPKNMSSFAFSSTKEPNEKQAESFTNKLISKGFDGIDHDGFNQWYVAFKANQIKSATGNNGQFDSSNNDIRYSKTDPTVGDTFTAPAETKLQHQQRLWQDENNRWTVLQDALKKAGGIVNGDNNVYKAMERMPHIAAKRIKDYSVTHIEPLYERMTKIKTTHDDVSLLAYARHAEERNREIGKKNPGKGSGMTDQEAKDNIDKLKARYGDNFNELEQIAKKFQAVTKDTLDILESTGAVSKEAVEKMRSAYQNYVPLKGFEILDEDGNQTNGTGLGFSTGKSFGKRALGRESKAGQIIENIIRDYERAVVWQEKTNVAKTLGRLIEDNPDDKIWTQGVAQLKPALIKGKREYYLFYNGSFVGKAKDANDMRKFRDAEIARTGQDKKDYRINVIKADDKVGAMPAPFDAEKEIRYLENGKEVRIQLHDELALRSFNKLGKNSVNGVFQTASTFNSFLREMWTQKNPAFFLINPIRDVQTASIVLTGEGGVKFAASAMKQWGSSWKTMLNHAMGKQSSPTEQAMLERYRESGGSVGTAYISSLEKVNDDIHHALQRLGGESIQQLIRDGKIKEAANSAAFRLLNNKLFDAIEHLNQAFEGATRLATFKAAIEAGYSDHEAASLSSNVTVNFTKKGEYGGQLGAMYLFANAGIQGNTNVFKTLTQSEYKGQAWGIVGSLAILGFMAAMTSGDDGDDDLVSDYEKQRNIVFKFGDKRLNIPLPYGWSFFSDIGRAMAQVTNGGDPELISKKLASTFLGNFSPIGNPIPSAKLSAEDALVAFAPTFSKPFVMPAVNRGSFGSPLMPESPFKPNQPDSQKVYRKTRGSVYDTAATTLNGLTGGDKAQSGWIDVSPETIKNTVNYIAGGAGRFITDSLSAGETAFNPSEPMKPEAWPVIKSFYKSESIDDFRRRGFEQLNEIDKIAEQFSTYKKERDIAGMNELRKESGNLLRLSKTADSTRKQIKSIRDREDKVRDNGGDIGQIKSLENKERLILNRLNRMVAG